jgi:hypothetical protein
LFTENTGGIGQQENPIRCPSLCHNNVNVSLGELQSHRSYNFIKVFLFADSGNKSEQDYQSERLSSLAEWDNKVIVLCVSRTCINYLISTYFKR